MRMQVRFLAFHRWSLFRRQDDLNVSRSEIAVEREEWLVLRYGQGVGEAVAEIQWILKSCGRGGALGVFEVIK